MHGSGNFICNGACLCCAREKGGIDKPRLYRPYNTDLRLYSEEDDMALERRTIPAAKALPTEPAWEDPVFTRDYPSITSFLRDCTWDDGTVRVPGSISLFCQMGTLKAAVSDKARSVIAFVSAPTWEELLALLEMGICNDSLDWKAPRAVPSGNRPPY